MNSFCLDSTYSTTRLLCKIAPIEKQGINIGPNTNLSEHDSINRKSEGGLRVKGYFKRNYRKLSNGVFLSTKDNFNVEPTQFLGDCEESEIALLSIIMVVFNGQKYIEEAILSVVSQTYQNIEFIIIDGGSTDGTLDTIKSHDSIVDYWVSEKDEGIYDAMNKGIDLANGKWLYFLGADDILASNKTIESVFCELRQCSPTTMLVFGNVITDRQKVIQSRLDRKIFLHNTLHHQSCFYNRSIFSNFRYDRELSISSDYEVNLKSYINNYCYKSIPVLIAMCRDGGISTSRKSFLKYIAETNAIRGRHVRHSLNMFLKIILITKCYLHYAIRYL